MKLLLLCRPSAFLLLIFFASLTARAASDDAPRVEVHGQKIEQRDNKTYVLGSAVAVFGSTRIYADEIVFDESSGTLKSVGPTLIQTEKVSIKAVDATVETKAKTTAINPLLLKNVRDYPSARY